MRAGWGPFSNSKQAGTGEQVWQEHYAHACNKLRTTCAPSPDWRLPHLGGWGRADGWAVSCSVRTICLRRIKEAVGNYPILRCASITRTSRSALVTPPAAPEHLVIEEMAASHTHLCHVWKVPSLPINVACRFALRRTSGNRPPTTLLPPGLLRAPQSYGKQPWHLMEAAPLLIIMLLPNSLPCIYSYEVLITIVHYSAG